MSKHLNRPSEVWHPISGYEDRYSVSNWGRIKSHSYAEGLIFHTH